MPRKTKRQADQTQLPLPGIGETAKRIRSNKTNTEANALIESSAESGTFHQIVMFHGAAMVRRLRGFSFAKRMVMMREATDISLEWALHIAGPKKQFVVPSWGQEPLSGAQVVALMVFGAWVQIGEREDLAASLLADWPEILDAKKLGYLDDHY